MNAAARSSKLNHSSAPLLERALAGLRGLIAPVDPILAGTIDDEIEHHILERADLLMQQGMDPEAAEAEARKRFGSVGKTRSTLARIGHSGDGGRRGSEFLGSVARDIRQGVRKIRTAPGFAMAVILTIGVGVGANAAVFSITDAVLLRPLPYGKPQELIKIQHVDAETDRVRQEMRSDEGLVWEREGSSVVDMTLYGLTRFTRTDGDEPTSVMARAVSANWLQTLDTAPALGRSFGDGDSAPGAPGVVIVSHGFWQSQLAGNDDVVGAVVELDHAPFTVVGVMPSDFKFPPLGPNDAWVPLASDASAAGRPVPGLSILARLPEGLTLDGAQERLDAITSGLEATAPQERGWNVRADVFDNFRANTDVEQALWVLTGTVGVMLLIAMVNAANLLLLQATARRDEVSLRLALGASRRRLVRQYLTENMVLVAVAGLFAVALAHAVLNSIVALLPSEITFFLTSIIAIDYRVLTFSLAVTIGAGLALSLVPALRATRSTPRNTGRWSSPGAGRGWLRSTLVVVEVAMTVTLLIGAGLLVNSFLRLTSVDPGYNVDNLIGLSVNLPTDSYPTSTERGLFFDELLGSLEALPGIESAALSDGMPPGGGAISFGVKPQAEGNDPKDFPGFYIPSVRVAPSFFETLQMPILAGRNFDERDSRASGSVIIDRDTSRFLWGEESPIGRRFKLDSDDPEEPWLTVVGLVGDVKLTGQDDRQGSLDLFYPLGDEDVRSYMSVAVRTATDTSGVMPLIRQATLDIDPYLPLASFQTGEQMMTAVNDKPRFFLRMMTIFATMALFVAAVGTYAVLTFAVRERQRELGVRIALGAGATRLKGMVLRQGMTTVGIGVAIGVAGAWALGDVARSLLFEIEPTDPLTFVLVALIMLASAAVACWLPARRATRVDPIEVLRAD